MEPMNKLRSDLEGKGRTRAQFAAFGGLAFMALQWGFLARLTWWEYSWDLMEPVTYFITTGNGIAFMIYYIVTRQDFEYASAFESTHVKALHKLAKRKGLDVNTYNKNIVKLKELEDELQRL
eukprot:m.21406 g.21406  ORF g.21406 m.21406 type:complete len:122 (+) comp12687_c0_seq3:637-1002(+)